MRSTYLPCNIIETWSLLSPLIHAAFFVDAVGVILDILETILVDDSAGLFGLGPDSPYFGYLSVSKVLEEDFFIFPLMGENGIRRYSGSEELFQFQRFVF